MCLSVCNVSNCSCLCQDLYLTFLSKTRSNTWDIEH